jgi:hypothetical protein
MTENFEPNSVNAILSRMETKLDAALETVKQHSVEIDNLKSWRWFTAGLGAGAAFLLERLFGR